MQKNTTRMGMCALIILMLIAAWALPASATDQITADIPAESGTSTPNEPTMPPVVTPEPDPPTPDPPTADPYPVETPEPTMPPVEETDPPPVPTEAPATEPPPPDPVTAAPPVATDTPQYENNTGNQNNTENRATSTPRRTASPNGSGQVKRPKATLRPLDDIQSNADTPQSDYVVFAKLNLRQNSLAVNMFWGGIVCIVIGAAGMIGLVALFIRNRRYAQNANEGIFEEIEAAETRVQPYLFDFSTEDEQQEMQPEDAEMYEDDTDPDFGDTSNESRYSTEEILREVLRENPESDRDDDWD